jgi:3'(2'), 5'-bisphosphate nucleotidase
MYSIALELDRRIRPVLVQCEHQIRQLRLQPLKIAQKGPEDYVTSVDLALNQHLETAFATLFPQDAVITEENTGSRRLYTQNSRRLWCIDPLDGTQDFMRGTWEYAVMIGLLQNGLPIAGWVYAPAYQQLYCGGAGWGVYQTSLALESTLDQPLLPIPLIAPPAPRTGFCPVIIGLRDRQQFGSAIAAEIPQIQFYSLGSFGLKVMEVVLGRAGLYLYCNQRVKVWDTVAPLAIAQAAGLTCCDLDGQPIRFTLDAIDQDSLAHQQTIVIGWASYVEQLRPRLRAAIQAA